MVPLEHLLKKLTVLPSIRGFTVFYRERERRSSETVSYMLSLSTHENDRVLNSAPLARTRPSHSSAIFTGFGALFLSLTVLILYPSLIGQTRGVGGGVSSGDTVFPVQSSPVQPSFEMEIRRSSDEEEEMPLINLVVGSRRTRFSKIRTTPRAVGGGLLKRGPSLSADGGDEGSGRRRRGRG